MTEYFSFDPATGHAVRGSRHPVRIIRPAASVISGTAPTAARGHLMTAPWIRTTSRMTSMMAAALMAISATATTATPTPQPLRTSSPSRPGRSRGRSL